MHNLVSERRPEDAFKEPVTADKFAEEILGFEEVDENEEEGEEEGEDAQMEQTQ